MTTLREWLFPKEPCPIESYHREILSCLPESGQALDLGCGNNTDLARYRTAGRAVWGADFQQHPQLQHPDWFRLLPDNGRIPFPDRTFDLVTSRWVLEHVELPVTFLEEIARVLKPGGAFVSVSINGLHYVTWISRFFHLLPHWVTEQLVQRLYGRPCHDTFPTWYRLNTGRRLHRAARQASLEFTAFERFANAHYFAFLTPLYHLATCTDWALEKLCPGMGRIFFVVTLTTPATTADTAPSPLAA
jgi:ubiquinone/menaquinone biosynthesis C-methylase UbiE